MTISGDMIRIKTIAFKNFFPENVYRKKAIAPMVPSKVAMMEELAATMIELSAASSNSSF